MQIEVTGSDALMICKLLDDVGSSSVGSRYKANHLLWKFITDNFPQTREGNWKIEVAGCTVTLLKISEEPKKEIAISSKSLDIGFIAFVITLVLIVLIVGSYVVKFGGYLSMFLWR